MKTLIFSAATLVLLSIIYLQKQAYAGVPIHNSYQKSITFKIADVPLATDTLEMMPYGEILHNAYVRDVLIMQEEMYQGNSEFTPPNRRLECFSRDRQPLVPAAINGFFEAVHKAYARHMPLVISPDMIWLVIVQGLARHIHENSETLRSHFVQHNGKKTINVHLDGKISLGSDDSDWEWAFQQFQDSVAAYTNQALAQTIAGRFSGTNSDAAVAFDIALMDAMSPYFDYWGDVSCGIPELTLEGTPEDWQQIELRAAQLAKYDLEWWISDLQPILAQFTRTAQGQPDRNFWAGMIRDLRDMGCGARSDHFVTGWIVRLFPYIRQGEKYIRNPLIGLKMEDLYTIVPPSQKDAAINLQDIQPGTAFELSPVNQYDLCDNNHTHTVLYTGPKVTFADVPSGICDVILNIDDNGNLHKMELKAGFFGIRQNTQTKALRPEIGWAIIDTGEKPDTAPPGSRHQ